MEDIYTGNGEGEADHGEVAQRLAPIGHFCQEGGWTENVGKWYYPSPGARATHLWNMVASQVGTGAMEEMPCEAERKGRNALASSCHLGLVLPIAPNPAGSQLTWSLPWSTGRAEELFAGSNPGQVASKVSLTLTFSESQWARQANKVRMVFNETPCSHHQKQTFPRCT